VFVGVQFLNIPTKMVPKQTLIVDFFILLFSVYCWFLFQHKSNSAIHPIQSNPTEHRVEVENLTTHIAGCIHQCLVSNNLTEWIQQQQSSTMENGRQYTDSIKEMLLVAIGATVGFIVAVGLLKLDQQPSRMH